MKFSKREKNAIRNQFIAFFVALAISSCASPVLPSTATPIANPPISSKTPVQEPTLSPLNTTKPLTSGTPESPLAFDGNHAYNEYLLAQMKFGIRPAGSKAVRATGDYIIQELTKSGWRVETQEFTYRGVPIRNVIGTYGAGQGPLLIIGAHYDTRPRANMDPTNPNDPVPGANDGASGVAVLLELARTLDKTKLKNEIRLAFFDAEDNGDLSACDLRVVPIQIDSPACDPTVWTWSIGASHVADNLATKPAAVIVIDMIGDADQNIYYERNSNPQLQQQLWNTAAQLGYAQWFIPKDRWSMSDDHTPFLQKKIPAVDMIDFDYPPWHTTADTADKVSAASLERVGRVLESWLHGQ